MKTTELPDKIMDYAFELAAISFPGTIPAEKSAKEAYKQLTESIMLKPIKSIKRILPRRLRRVRASEVTNKPLAK